MGLLNERRLITALTAFHRSVYSSCYCCCCYYYYVLRRHVVAILIGGLRCAGAVLRCTCWRGSY
eukprot:31368-Rhodomonas_salina.1